MEDNFTFFNIELQSNIIWKPIKDFENIYEISSNGQVRSLARIVPVQGKGRLVKGRRMTSRIGRDGYGAVRLSKNGSTYTRYVHRLLAEAFVPNPMEKPIVNHINGNKLDNRIENLEWVTHPENIRYAYLKGLINKSKLRRKRVVDKCTGDHFGSIKEAARKLRIPYKTCVNYLNGHPRNPTCLEIEM